MRVKRRKRIFIIILSIIIIAFLGFIFLLLNNHGNSRSFAKENYRSAGIFEDNIHRPAGGDPGFKTRDGGTEDSKVVVSLGDPPIGRKAETFKIDILESPGDGSEISVLSANIKEGETLYLDNNLKAGKYYQLGISKPDAKKGKQYIITYYWSPDESKLDIPRPYVG